MSEPAPVERDAGRRPVRRWRTSAVLSPRALPTDTSVRFLLLIAAVIAASLYLYEALWVVLRGEAFLDPALDCGTGHPGAADPTVLLGPQGECRSGTDPEQATFAVAGTVLVLLAAYGVYRLLPLLRTRRSRLVQLDQDDAAALHQDVRQAAAEAGLGQAPEVLVDAANPAVQAFAYGTTRHPRLGLTGGLVVLQVVDPPAFRAVLRHEIAHLANRDVPWTYYTVATWWSFVALALVPVLAVFVVSDIRYVLRLGWRTLLLAVLVLLVRNAVLRAREVYADARAAEWGAGPDLDRVLRMQPAPRGRRHLWLRLHPPADARRRLLADPDRLFGVDAATALAAGLAAGTAYPTVRAVADLALPTAVASVGAALLVAPLLAAVVTAGAWRAELRSVVRGVPVPVTGPLTLGTGIGLAAGPLLSFQAAAGGLVVGVAGVRGYLVWAVVTLFSTGLVAWYVAGAGRLAVKAGLRRSSPWPLLVPHEIAVAAAFVVLLAYGYPALLYVGGAEPTAALRAWSLWGSLPSWFGDGGLLLLGVAGLLVAAPLAATWSLRGPAAAAGPAAAWPWRELPPPDLPPAHEPTRTLVLLGGLAAVVVAGMVAVGLLSPASPERVEGPGYTVALPVGWTSASGTDDVPVLANDDRTVQVDMRPVTATAPAAAPGILDVGGVPAWFVGQQSEGGRLLRAYDMDAPPGPYRLRVLGSPEALGSADGEVAELLADVRWSGRVEGED
jgi:Zn-dependent protease with chaperone function